MERLLVGLGVRSSGEGGAERAGSRAAAGAGGEQEEAEAQGAKEGGVPCCTSVGDRGVAAVARARCAGGMGVDALGGVRVSQPGRPPGCDSARAFSGCGAGEARMGDATKVRYVK